MELSFSPCFTTRRQTARELRPLALSFSALSLIGYCHVNRNFVFAGKNVTDLLPTESKLIGVLRVASAFEKK